MKSRMRLTLMALAALLVVGTASPATAERGHESRIAHGQFQTLPGGTDLGYTVEGRAVMVRVLNRTFVAVRVRGLDPRTTYPVHVHNAPCADPTFGGSHYQHEIGGAADDVNEIWPFVTTNKAGRGVGIATHGHRARSDAMSIVIHYPANTAIRLACVDLS